MSKSPKSTRSDRRERKPAGRREAVTRRSFLAPLLESPVKAAAVLFVVAFLLYANTLGHEFVWDDLDLVVENPLMGEMGPGDVGELFTTDYWNAYRSGGYYRPLTTLSYHLQHAVFRGQAGGFHFANVMWNAILTVLIFAFLYLLFADAALAWVSALLFAVIPIHTESVAWVSGRTDVLSMLWAVASLLLYLQFRRRGTLWLLPAAMVAFLFALFAKESVVLLPLVVLVLELPPLRALTAGEGSRAPLWAAPAGIAGMFAMAGLYMVLRINAIGTTFAAYDGYADSAGGVVALPLSVLAGYAGKLLYPFALSAEWDAPTPESLAAPHAIAGAVVVLAIVVALLRFRRSPAIVLGIAVFVLGVIPVLNIIPIGEISAERFLYFPSLGFVLVLGAILAPALRSGRRNLLWVLVVIVVAWSARTVTRNPVWANEKVLFTTTVRDTPDSPRARVNLGDVALREGRVPDAVTLYRQALEIDPDYSLALSNLAGVYFRQGQLDQAQPLIERAVRSEPDNAGLLSNLGLMYLEQGRQDDAADTLERALALDPDQPIANYSLGRLRFSQGRMDAARDHFVRVIDKGRAYELSGYYLAEIEFRAGNRQAARAYAERFRQTHGRSDEYFRRAGQILQQTSR